MERKALFAGSFDPLTNGHLNIIERAAAMYDSLTVAVVVNPQKTGFFTVDERVEIAGEVTGHIPNVRIDSFSGLLADYVNENGFAAEKGFSASLGPWAAREPPLLEESQDLGQHLLPTPRV